MIIVTHDATVQRETKAALVEANTMLRSFLKLNRANFWSIAPDGLLTFATAIGSLASENQVGTTIRAEQAARPVHPDDVNRVNDLQQHCFSTATNFDCEYRRLIDGSFRWARARAFPRFDDTGDLVCWYGSTEDIDDRKTAELRLVESEAFSRRLIDASVDIIQLIDLDGQLSFTNARGLESLGISSPDLIAGNQWAALWPSEAQPLAEHAIKQARAGGVGEFAAIGAGHAKGARWWSVVVTQVLDSSGDITGLMAISPISPRISLRSNRSAG